MRRTGRTSIDVDAVNRKIIRLRQGSNWRRRALKMQTGDYGKNADGSISRDYCRYCFPNGKFGKDETMEEMIESNLQFLSEFNKANGTNYTPDEARAKMREYFPTLKRWRTGV